MAPSPNSVPSSSGQASQQEIIEKYGSLKRRYVELEQESNSETNRSDERNVRMREERDYVLQKMKELEHSTQVNLATNSLLQESLSLGVSTDQLNSNMLPRTSLDPKAHDDPMKLQESLRREDDDKPSNQGADTRGKGRASRRRGSAAGTSPQSRNPRSPGSPPSTVPISGENGPASSSTSRGRNGDNDVEMEDGRASGYSYSRGSSVAQSRREQQERDGQASEQAEPSPRRETRATRQNRGLRNDGTVIAAVAAATAEAEAAAAVAAGQPSGRIPTQSASLNHASSPMQNDARVGDNSKQVSSPSSTLAHALGQTAENSPSKDTPATSINAQTHMQHAPSMESILKVAEAAVAAQNAAAAANQAAKAGSSSNMDPNLDPSLFSDSNNGVQRTSKTTNGHSSSASKPPQVNTTATNANNQNATASSSTSTPTSTTPTSSLSNNPYLSLSTNLIPRAAGPSSSASPTGHPMLMPYPLFYPPGTPVTPNSPSYPMPYNPYYYLAAPMGPAQNGMYAPPPPANANFPPAQQQQQQPSERQKPKAVQKMKRLKAHMVTTKSFSIPLVPRDKNRKPMLPLNVGIMTVINLGEVCMREHFHTERYIFPVGYEVTRRYLSTVDPAIEVVYHCTILDGGDGPKFQIIPSDRPDKPIIAGTATGAWSNIVKQANAIRNRQHSNSVSGPDFFGLGQNTIKHLIQELPNAGRLRDYVWQNFVEGGPLGGRHAAVIPALPEEYDASMPIGAYYPKRDVSSDPNVPRGMSHYPQHIIAQAEAQKAQRLATQAQEQAIAGPSGSISAPTPLQQGPIPSSSHQLPQQLSIPEAPTLNIQEYHPNQSLPGQSVSQGPEKRATRSNATATANPSVSASPASARNTRAAARGNQQQQQQQQQQGNDAGFSSISTDGTMPTTIAGIMNAYPAPGIPGTNGAAPN